MASGLIRWRMSLAVSATLVRSCSTVSVRPARVCSVSRLICCSEWVLVCGMTQSSVTNYLKPEPPMMALVPDDASERLLTHDTAGRGRMSRKLSDGVIESRFRNILKVAEAYCRGLIVL